MNANWISPRTVVGPVATGDCYYPRTEIVNDIWQELERGSYVLISAPRRVGKTSVMRDIEANPRGNYKVKFESVQAVTSEIDFYKTLYRLVLNCLNTSSKASKWLAAYMKTKKITEITTSGVKIGDAELDYRQEINAIFKELDSNSETIVLLLDELPEVLFRLYKEGKKDEAIAILNQLRTWRQSDFKKLQFVLAGSVGIHHVVKIVEGRTSSLNDLTQAICCPLDRSEALNYIGWATGNGATVQYNENQRGYLLDKVAGYYTPYFINLMLDEVNKIARKRADSIIIESDIDRAFVNVEKDNQHFRDWKNRLKAYMAPSDFDFVNEILTHISHRDSINIQVIYDKATKHKKTNDYMELMDDLERDGYITASSEGSQTYIFISPFLKAFWKRNNPIYNE